LSHILRGTYFKNMELSLISVNNRVIIVGSDRKSDPSELNYLL